MSSAPAVAGDWPALGRAAGHQSRAGLMLAAALADRPSHAWLFTGPAGSGRRDLARAFAAELLALDSATPDEVRRRALQDPSPHPDLVWLRPGGAGYAIEEVRSRVVRKAHLNPFEGGRRVFVIESAEALGEDAQNALLKTLEEPPAHAHLLLIADRSAAVLPTVTSRLRQVSLDPLSPEVVREQLAGLEEARDLSAKSREAVARLSRGDLARARMLVSRRGRGLRDAVERLAGALLEDRLADSPWLALLEAAEAAGTEAEEAARTGLEADREDGVKHTARERDDALRRARRQARTRTLELALSLLANWARDWVCLLSDRPGLAFNADRVDLLAAQAATVTPGAAREAVGIVNRTARRFRLNVSEELALEAMSFRLEARLNR